MFKIQIPKPCKENWNEMQPTQQGAFCAACSKQVVDFTRMTDAEVQHYFLNNSSSKTCGKFKTEQLERISIYLPENILLQHIAGWKKFMAVILMAFGSILFGCNVDTKQNANLNKPEKIETTQVKDTLQIETLGAPRLVTPVITDSVIEEYNIMGEPAFVDTTVSTLTGITTVTENTTVHAGIDSSVVMGRPLPVNTVIKKPVSNTKECKDTGYY